MQQQPKALSSCTLKRRKFEVGKACGLGWYESSLGSAEVYRGVRISLLRRAGGSTWLTFIRAMTMWRRRRKTDVTGEVHYFAGSQRTEIATDTVVDDCRAKMSLPGCLLENNIQFGLPVILYSESDRNSDH